VRVLFDQGTPVPLRRHLPEHRVDTAYERGWSKLRNSALLERAEDDGYQLLITTDQSLRYQQDLANRELAVLVLMSTAWPRIRLRTEATRAEIDEIGRGECIEVEV